MEAFRKIYPSEFYKKFLVQDVRPDGRGLNKIRKTTVSGGMAEA
jgi:exosome complex component RRP43